jgi:hypothetical protein
MLGKPKYKQGQLVRFEFDNEIMEGTIEIVDAYGTWADPSDVSYDILGLNDCFYKHVREDFII